MEQLSSFLPMEIQMELCGPLIMVRQSGMPGRRRALFYMRTMPTMWRLNFIAVRKIPQMRLDWE